MNSYESSYRQARIWAIALVLAVFVAFGSIGGYYAYKLHVNEGRAIVKTVLVYNGGPEQEILTPTSTP